MKRRAFITLLGGAAAAWPLAARAQLRDQVPHIGVLMGLSESDPEAQSSIAAFRKTLQGLGWTEGRNVQADYYWAAGDIDRLSITHIFGLLSGTSGDENLNQKNPL